MGAVRRTGGRSGEDRQHFGAIAPFMSFEGNSVSGAEQSPQDHRTFIPIPMNAAWLEGDTGPPSILS